MSIILMGENQVPFDRSFFNVELDELLKGDSHGAVQRLTLFLTDGLSLDVCKIEKLAPHHLVLRAYSSEAEACDVLRHVVPYGLIYRLELAPRKEDDKRLGFAGVRTAKAETRPRRPRA